MRLWKRGPATFCAIALVILVANIVLSLIPVAGVALAQLLLPLVECGLLYASLAADRGDRPRLRHVIAVFAAPPRAIAAVIASAIAIFAAEVLGAHAFGFDMLAPAPGVDAISPSALIATYAAGIAASLPLTFVPFAALFDDADFLGAFAQSGQAFARNVLPLALYGALSFVLLVLGIATSGVGLLLVLPWSAAASYAAWKDVYGVT